MTGFRDGKPRRPSLYRQEAPKRETPASRIVAFDLETTRIRKGTPRVKYISAYSENPNFSLSQRCDSLTELRAILDEKFLIPEMYGVRFVAWNGNNFDAYFVAAALLLDDKYIMRPYLTRSNALRGMRVIPRNCFDPDGKPKEAWEFLDGIAMTGLQGWTLKKFTEKFSPEHQKMAGVINFEKEEFDAENPTHCEYAYQDSVSLYYALRICEDILRERFNRALGATMGGACIKIFRSNIPERKIIYSVGESVEILIREQVMRGGYCYCVGRYEGPVWKYDLNQAYAAAMRDAKLPAGNCYHGAGKIHPAAQAFIVKVRAYKRGNKIPFYCKPVIGARAVAMFATDAIPDTWITSIEYFQLVAEGWRIEVLDSYFFDDTFSMKDFVNRLEHTRMNCEGGPGGAIGTMVKAVGNHSYGKTVESTDATELVLSKHCPPEYSEYIPDDPDAVLSHVWQRQKAPTVRDYHQPQIGAFITAHVRMVVRRAALIAPEAWLYADTDCVVFARNVTKYLPIDAKRYGFWKQETDGEPYRIIAKKVYAEIGFDESSDAVKHAKGLNVKKLTDEDFEAWFRGTLPVQTQVQRQNFVKVMQGTEMFLERTRKGTAV